MNTQVYYGRRAVIYFSLLLVGVWLGFSATTWAASGTEGAAFLDIPVGAGPAALGSAYSALATNAYAPIWNPAGLGFVSAPEVAAQHLSYLESIDYEFGSVVVPLKNMHAAVGTSIQYLGSGNINGTNPDGTPAADFSVYYGAYSLAYGQELNEKLSLGFTGKVINAKIDNVSATAYAGDVGALYKATPKLQLAATVTNVGSQLTFTDQSDSLPLTAHIAAAYQPETHVTLVAEGLHSQNGQTDGRFGAEWRPLEAVALRAGYRTDAIEKLSALAGFSTGVGVTLWGQEFAYAWLPYGDLGDTQYFSLLLRFGKPEEEKRNLIQYQNIKTHRTAGALRLQPNDSEYLQLMQMLEETQEPVAQVQSTEPNR